MPLDISTSAELTLRLERLSATEAADRVWPKTDCPLSRWHWRKLTSSPIEGSWYAPQGAGADAQTRRG